MRHCNATKYIDGMVPLIGPNNFLVCRANLEFYRNSLNMPVRRAFSGHNLNNLIHQDPRTIIKHCIFLKVTFGFNRRLSTEL